MHAQYQATQALLRQPLPELQKRGIVDADGYVTLYRGIKPYEQGPELERGFASSSDGSIDMAVRAASSWSASHKIARRHAHAEGTVVQQRVHVSNALVVHHFEPSWRMEEVEWTLFSPDEKFTVVRADESTRDPY